MKTKRLAMLFAILLMFSTMFSVTAAAEEEESGKSSEKETIVIGSDAEDTLRLESSTEIGNLIEVTPHAARVCDTLGKYGYESDEKNEFVIVDFDICNISKDTINLDQLINASLSYKDDYSFNVFNGAEIDEMNALLLGSWDVIWDSNGGYLCGTMDFTGINKDGELEGSFVFEPYNYDGDYICPYSGECTVLASYEESKLFWRITTDKWIENPDEYNDLIFRFKMVKPFILCGTRTIKDKEYGYIYMEKNNDSESSTELDILEETSYSLIFKCPNRVVEDLKNCALYISIDDEVYEVPLQ